jgi:hypothetical protein
LHHHVLVYSQVAVREVVVFQLEKYESNIYRSKRGEDVIKRKMEKRERAVITNGMMAFTFKLKNNDTDLDFLVGFNGEIRGKV